MPLDTRIAHHKILALGFLIGTPLVLQSIAQADQYKITYENGVEHRIEADEMIETAQSYVLRRGGMELDLNKVGVKSIVVVEKTPPRAKPEYASPAREEAVRVYTDDDLKKYDVEQKPIRKSQRASQAKKSYRASVPKPKKSVTDHSHKRIKKLRRQEAKLLNKKRKLELDIQDYKNQLEVLGRGQGRIITTSPNPPDTSREDRAISRYEAKLGKKEADLAFVEQELDRVLKELREAQGW